MDVAADTALTEAEVERWFQVGALAAVALVLGYLETFVPIPIPGVKLGLANVAVLLALAQGDLWAACWVALVKVLASGLLFGNPVTMAYSAVGTALSLLVMAPLSRLRTMRLWMVSVTGALAHEIGQLLVAQAMLGTPLVWYSAPALLAASCATGVLCGAIAERSLRLLKEESSATAQALPSTKAQLPSRGSAGGRVNPKLALVALVVFSILALRLSSPHALAVCLALAALACLLAGVRKADLIRALRPVALICAVTLLAQLLTAPPQEALQAAGVSMLRLLALVSASLAFVSAQSQDELLSGMQWALTPLQRLGLCTAGPLLALDVALKLLPCLASGLSLQGASTASLSQLVADAYRMASDLTLPADEATPAQQA